MHMTFDDFTPLLNLLGHSDYPRTSPGLLFLDDSWLRVLPNWHFQSDLVFEGSVAPTDKKLQPIQIQLEKTGNLVVVVVEVLFLSNRISCNQLDN
jgi:hypothetical protein